MDCKCINRRRKNNRTKYRLHRARFILIRHTTDQTHGIVDQITELTKSIYKHGGFYIGRYEAGSKTPRTSSSGVTEIGIKQDMYPYIYVKWGDSMSSIGTTGAVYLSNSLYTYK